MKSALPLFVGASIAFHGAGMLASWPSEAPHPDVGTLSVQLIEPEATAMPTADPIDASATHELRREPELPTHHRIADNQPGHQEQASAPRMDKPVPQAMVAAAQQKLTNANVETRHPDLQPAKWTLAPTPQTPPSVTTTRHEATFQPSVERKTDSFISAEETRDRLQMSLHDALSRYFYYPRMAQRHGWQGEVTLALRVEADGHLTGVRIAESSGYAILDEAAAAALEKIPRLGKAATWLRGTHFDMVLPVRYQLVDG